MIGILNIGDGAHIGKEELVRQQVMHKNRDDLTTTLVGYGIRNFDDFVVGPGHTPGYISIRNKDTTRKESYAVDIDGCPIYFTNNDGVYVGNETVNISISKEENYTEEGRVTIFSQDTGQNRAGTIIGIGTKFLDLFRPISNYKQNRIELYESDARGLPRQSPIGQYEIVDVVSNNNMSVVGNFPNTNMSNLFFRVVGTFSQDIVPTNDNRFSYRYDKCTLNIYSSISEEERRRVDEEGKEFFIASVSNGGASITDTRNKFLDTQNKISNLEAEIDKVNQLLELDVNLLQRVIEKVNMTTEWKLASLARGWMLWDSDRGGPYDAASGGGHGTITPEGHYNILEPLNLNPRAGIYYRFNMGNLEISGGMITPLNFDSPNAGFERYNGFTSMFRLQTEDNELLLNALKKNPVQVLRNVGFYGSYNRLFAPLGKFSLRIIKSGATRSEINAVEAGDLVFMASSREAYPTGRRYGGSAETWSSHNTMLGGICSFIGYVSGTFYL